MIANAMPRPNPDTPLCRLLVRDLVLLADIGVYQHEHGRPQRVRINLDLEVAEADRIDDRLDRVLNYDALIQSVRTLVGTGRVNLVETLAERIAGLCLEDSRVRTATVRVEKLDLFTDVAAVGVEILRRNV